MIYPPRPKVATTPQELSKYDNGRFIAQAKFNGSYAIVHCLNGIATVFNRHGDNKTGEWKIDCPIDGIICGEYMNKGSLYNDCNFIIYDAIDIMGVSMIGKTYEHRFGQLRYLAEKYKTHMQPDSKFCEHISNKTGIAVSILSGFNEAYNEIVRVPILEGVVLKKITGRLLPCNSDTANSGWQLKVRKPNKLYEF